MLAQVNEQLTATNNRLQLELQKSANNAASIPTLKIPDINKTLNSFKIAKLIQSMRWMSKQVLRHRIVQELLCSMA